LIKKMPPIIYNIPASMLDMYKGRSLVIRTHNLSELKKSLTPDVLKNLVNIQLLTLKDTALRNSHICDAPLDVMVSDPLSDLPRLYNYKQWVKKYPVRVSVPVVPGFIKIVKLSAALNFAVRLLPQQPGREQVEEMVQVLHFYLHQSTVSQPIEFFHTMLFAFFNDEAVNLWTILEENPLQSRYITDHGRETLSARLADIELPDDLSVFEVTVIKPLREKTLECNSCEFLANCDTYFKWPNREFRCDGVKSLLRMLQKAAAELKRDYAASADATEPKPL